MRLTPELLAACYELVRASVPSWKLPHCSEIKFTVIRHKSIHADYLFDGAHRIRVSRDKHNHLVTVLRSVAHEACHLRAWLVNPGEKAEHGAQFHKAAKTLCRIWGWDSAEF